MTLNDRLIRTLGEQAWMVLQLQQRIDDLTAELAALKMQAAATKADTTT